MTHVLIFVTHVLIFVCCSVPILILLVIHVLIFVAKISYHCSTLQHTAARCNTLQHTASYVGPMKARVSISEGPTECSTLLVTHVLIFVAKILYNCSTLQHTTTRCNTLQHTATRCNTLQHAATHCNTLQHNNGACVYIRGPYIALDTCCSVLQRVVVCCSVSISLQRVVVCCNVSISLQCVAVCCIVSISEDPT